MCCNATKNATISLKSDMLDGGGKRRFWKLISNSARSRLHTDYIWHEGINKAVCNQTRWSTYGNAYIRNGLHVYTNREAALSLVRVSRYWGGEASILEVIGEAKHLLGAEPSYYTCQTAAFSQVEVTKEGWRKFKKSVSDYNLKHRLSISR